MSKENNNFPNYPDKNVQKLRPFKHFCMTIGEIPTSYLASLTYYEMLLWFCNFLQNKVIPTINNNAHAIEELQNLYIELHDYVENYFKNLDVQEEINNKLDEMVEDGTLTNIIFNYVKITKIYNTTVEMIEDSNNLLNGQKIKTLGYYQINDGGNGYFYITDNNDTTDFQIELSNGLYATLILENNIVNVKSFGAHGDGQTDDSEFIQKAVNLINDKTITIQQTVPSNPNWTRNFSTSFLLYFPCSTYKINTPISFTKPYYNIDGNNSIIITNNKLNIFEFTGSGGTKADIQNFVFKDNYNSISYENDNIDVSKVNIRNCKFIGNENIAINFNNRSCMLKIENCIFSWCYKIFVNTRCDNAVFENCWFSEFQANENNYCSFKLLWGENKFINCFFIPNGNYNPDIVQSNFNNLCWIQAGDNEEPATNNLKIYIDKCRQSSERNAKTLINYMAVPSGSTSPNTSIIITNCNGLADTLNHTIVKLWHLPQQLIFENNNIVIENIAFISLDESLDIETELLNYFNFANRTVYTYDYSIKNNKTQTSTPYTLIPAKLIGLFRNCDFDIELPLPTENQEVEFPIGNASLTSTLYFNKMYLVKCYYNPINTGGGMSSVLGVLMFNAVNTSVLENPSIQVKFIKLTEFLGGSATSSNDTPTIKATFQNGEDNIAMSGNQQIKLRLSIDKNVYDINNSYFTIKPL